MERTQIGNEGATKRRRRWMGPLQILVVALLVLLAVLYACEPEGDDAPQLSPGRGEAPPPLVPIHRPEAASTVLRVAATGSVNVRNRVALIPQVGGRVVSLSPALRPGGAFAADEELLTIDRRDFELAYDQARADIATAQSSLLLEQAQSGAARANYALLNPGEEVPELVARIPQIAQARARLAAANARAEIAALDLARTSFSLPFAGHVTDSSAEIGQVLSRGQSFGQAFAEDAVEVIVPIPPDDLESLAPAVGRGAAIRYGDSVLAASVERVSPELDGRTRFATLYLKFDPDADPPPPGAFVDVEIEGPALTDTFLLPEAAEQVNGSVWVVSGGVLKRVTPRTLGRSAEGWLVAAFDAADGVVLGAVPGARDDLVVQTGADLADTEVGS